MMGMFRVGFGKQTMCDCEDKEELWEVQDVQRQVWDLQSTIEVLQNEITLLRNELNTVKMEGCWRWYENPNHEHKDIKKDIKND